MRIEPTDTHAEKILHVIEVMRLRPDETICALSVALGFALGGVNASGDALRLAEESMALAYKEARERMGK